MNRYSWALLLLLQVCVLTFAAFVDFGFDLPGQFGWSFGHFLIVVAMYGVLFLGGMSAAVMFREYRKILYQFLILLAICVLGVAYHLAVNPSVLREQPPDAQEIGP